MKNTIKIRESYQGAKETQDLFRPAVIILAFMITILLKPQNATAQSGWGYQGPGYYYMGSQRQVFQQNGVYTDHQGMMNGGYNVGVGPVNVGVQGYNNGYTYNYPGQRTQYQNVPYYYHSNGKSCDANMYYEYQIPSGSNVYGYYPKR